MRIATFNLESLDLPPKSHMPLPLRADILRPALGRLDADVVCLQEVNGQHVAGRHGRVLKALDELLVGTRYAEFHRAFTTAHDGQGVADVHNLVTLSRYPVMTSHEVLHQYLPEIAYSEQTTDPASRDRGKVRFNRPLLVTDFDVGGGRILTVINLHLRARLASNIAGQKLGPFVWKSVGSWAEGYFLSSLRRTAQALELRLLIDEIFKKDPHRLLAAVGDFNAEDHETPLAIVVGAEEDTGNTSLAPQSLVILDRAIPADRRWSVLHYGRPQMLDHILASRTLHGCFRRIEVHNEALGDEAIGYAKLDKPSGSYHAAVVAEFTLD